MLEDYDHEGIPEFFEENWEANTLDIYKYDGNRNFYKVASTPKFNQPM